MEKITQISIDSTLFSLEDSAYNKLSSYLSEIRNAFKDEQGGQEIVKDIEARIAEHLKENDKEFISAPLVDEIIEKMGTVSELTGKDKKSENEEVREEPSKNIIEEKFKKRLFRDEDNAILGGVCAGIAAYMDVDTTWVRVAFIALIFLGFGTIIPIYIVLWLIVPPAQSTSDKLEMRGNNVTLKTIVDTVRDKAKEVVGSENKNCEGDECNHKENGVKKTRNTLRRLFMAVGRVGAFFTGLFISFVSLAILIGFTAGATAVLTANISPEITGFMNSSGAHRYIWLGFLASIVCVTIPSMFMFIGGMTLIRRKPIVQVRYGFAIFSAWMVSIIILVILGTHYGIRFENYMEQVDHRNGVLGYEQVQNIHVIDFNDVSTGTVINPNQLETR